MIAGLLRTTLVFGMVLSVGVFAQPTKGPAAAKAEPEVGPFFESQQPFFQSQLELTPAPKGRFTGGNFVVRGLVLPLATGHVVVFDQELLRLAAIWKAPAGKSPTTEMTMAQISYASIRRKVNGEHPQPTGPLLLSVGMHPGVGVSADAVFTDPRPAGSPGDEGRGALPDTVGHFEGIQFSGTAAVLEYRVGSTRVREWHEARQAGDATLVLRHFEVAPHAEPLVFSSGAAGNSAPWTVTNGRAAFVEASEHGRVRVATNAAALTFKADRGELLATLAPSAETQRVSLAVILANKTAADTSATNGEGTDENRVGPTPALPAKLGKLRWPGKATAPAQLGSLQQNGLILDKIAVPEENPWKRRVRVADIAFLSADRAAVVAYDGDVWIVEGFADPKLEKLMWRRFASGLYEPLAIVAPQGVIQVATKNGVVRLYDRDGDGEADWLENFNDQLLQSMTTRSFPLDMALGPDGSTYISQGGIVSRSGMQSGGDGTAHTGGILRIAPDGKTSEQWSSGAREPFVAVHPKTGVVTSTDQQGHYIPSSVAYLVRKGDDFGYLQSEPKKLALPLAWVPHDQDTSSTSQAWMIGAGMGPFDGKLLHLSYGTGRVFVIAGDFDAPTPQGAVIPLELKTDLPLLHARMHPSGDALYFVGFQIWGTRTTTNWALGRLRRGSTPVVTAVDARSVADGVILTFAEPVDPASLAPEKFNVRAWNYKRSSAYGSGRYTLGGAAGTTPWGVSQVVASTDRKSIFVHLPKLPAVNQLEVRHDLKFASGVEARGVVYFTIHQPRPADLVAAGFPRVDLTKIATVVAKEKEEAATPALGKATAENLGCLACHSIDGTTEGKVGPTWRRLFGAKRTFVDGTSEVVDEAYIREKILDPQQKKTKPGQIEMPSYRGVLSETQMDSIVLYIKTLTGGRTAPKDDGE